MKLELSQFIDTNSKKESSLFISLSKLLEKSDKNQLNLLPRPGSSHERPLSHDEKLKSDNSSKVVTNLRSITLFHSFQFGSFNLHS